MKSKEKYIILFIIIIMAAILGGSQFAEVKLSDYEVQSFYLINDPNGKVSKMVIDTKNTDIIFTPEDYDEGACQICGNNLTRNFDIKTEGEVMYVKNKDNTSFEAQKIKIILPLYFKNDIDFEVNCVDSDLIFNRDFDNLQKEGNQKNNLRNYFITNMKSISGTVYGSIKGGVLKAENVNLKISGENNLQKIIAEEEHVDKI